MDFLTAITTAAAVGGVLSIVVRSRLVRIPRPSRRGDDRSPIGASTFQLWASAVASGGLAFLVSFAITGLVVVSLAPGLVFATFPHTYYKRQRSRQIAEVTAAWPDALRDLVSSVRAGSSLRSAIESLGQFGPEPLRAAFGGFGVYSRSLGVVPTLEMIRSDLADPTSDRVIEVMILAHERGGTAVPSILGDLADATTRDVWTMEQVLSESLEQKINSRVVFILPWLVLVAMTARSGAFREFYSSSAGILVVAIGGLMSLGGIFIANKIGAQPDEPRVFTGPGIERA